MFQCACSKTYNLFEIINLICYSSQLYLILIIRFYLHPRVCRRIPGAFCSFLFSDADLRNFNAARRTRIDDSNQIVVLMCLRIMRFIRGTNSHHSTSRMWGVTVFWTARHDVGSGFRHLRFVQLWSNGCRNRVMQRKSWPWYNLRNFEVKNGDAPNIEGAFSAAPLKTGWNCVV